MTQQREINLLFDRLEAWIAKRRKMRLLFAHVDAMRPTQLHNSGDYVAKVRALHSLIESEK